MRVQKIIMSVVALSLVLLTLQSHMAKEKATSKSEVKPFNIDDYTWLTGSWIGDGFGGVSEEVWAAPADGTMMGMYRHVKDGKLVFYEFLLLDKDGMRLKHFTPELKAWETKEEMVTFPMVEYSANKLVLKGLTFERKSDTEMEIRLKMKTGDKVETEVFKMKRK